MFWDTARRECHMDNRCSKRLLVIGPLPPPMAGPEMVTAILLSAGGLAKHFEVVHLNTTLRASNREKGRLDWTMILGYFRYVVGLVRILRGWRPTNVLYLPTSATSRGWVRDGTTIVLGRLGHASLSVVFQGGHFGYFYRSSPVLGQWIIRRLLNMVSGVYVQAERLKTQFEGVVPAYRLKVFPNSIPEQFLEEFLEAKINSSPEKTLLFVGHLTPAKGFTDLLRMFSRVSRLTGCHLMVLGERTGGGNVRFNQVTGEALPAENVDKVLEEEIFLHGLTDRVHFLGAGIFGKEKAEVFRSADVFVLPSYSEGFSTAMLEAMAAGLPVVATPVGAAPEVITLGTNGYLVMPGDVEGLIDCVMRLLSDDAIRQDMGAANKRLVRERFLAGCVSERLARDLLTRTKD